MMNETAGKILDYIERSPSCFHAVKNLADELRENGFAELKESGRWTLEENGKYFVTRNGSSIISFTIPKKDFRMFRITASHSDSPCFKVKENPEMKGHGCVRLNVEKYGGMLMNPWFDRPLSIAGRVCVENGGGAFDVETVLFDFKKSVAMIPSLAIHFARDANDGHKINTQAEMMPIVSTDTEFDFLAAVAKEIGVEKGKILSHDLFLYNNCKGSFWGADDEFISSAKLDDLECVYATFLGFLKSAKKAAADSVNVHAVFDNEEVGSGTRQGADSTFLEDTLRRINGAMGRDNEDYLSAIAESFLISADNAHAVHPNFADKSDLSNRPHLNEGIVIKYNAAQKYTSDAVSAGIFKRICAKAGVPFQIFTNNSNVAGGSTLGNISTSHVSLRSVDIGLAQWAMHSPLESAGAEDAEFLSKAAEAFYSA